MSASPDPTAAPMPPEPRRYHILGLAIGERFRFVAGGPIFARVGEPGDPVRVLPVDPRPHEPAASVDYQTFVLLVEEPAGEDSGSGIFDGLRFTGIDTDSAEEGGGL